MGWHSREAMSYEGDYFARYQELDATPMGEALTNARIELVRKYCDPSSVTDIGIGGGRFVLESGGYGYDVSEQARTWLELRGCYLDPYAHAHGVKAASCWDSLEHIPDPEALLATVQEWLFVSMPVYKDQADCLSSKHYKPSEHLFYFTIIGFSRWCERNGFEMIEINYAESDLGRDGIASFALKRFQ